MISRRAQVGWTTHGHSAVDVNIYASDPEQAEPLRGNRENTEIGKFLSEYLDLEEEMGVVTQELKDWKEGKKEWMGRRLGDGKVGNKGDHYEGDFRKRGVLECGCMGGRADGHVH
ncbi:MAG: hypothetical protein Q9180_009387 [Flavoplaca navasiana]